VSTLWIDSIFMYRSDFAYGLISTNVLLSLDLTMYVNMVSDRSVSMAAFFDMLAPCFDISVPS
jgi:hypothetical protein